MILFKLVRRNFVMYETKYEKCLNSKRNGKSVALTFRGTNYFKEAMQCIRRRNCFSLVWKMCSNESSCSTVGNHCSNVNELDYKLIKEGSAEIELPKGNKVFYNPVQEFNRDLSVSVLQVVAQEYFEKSQEGKKIRILEALSATGLRSIRYAKEIPNVAEVIANDISQSAIEIVDKNIARNGVGNIVKSSHCDASEIMFNNRHSSKRFQVVDLDPFGCPTQFLDSAVQCVQDGGVLLVTCTDMAVLCGNSPEACFVKYGGISLKNNAHHEMALRLTLNCIQSQAAKYKRYIVPLLSVSVDFYIRLIVQIFTSASKCKENISKLAIVYSCNRCDSTYLQPLGMIKNKNESGKNPVYSPSTGPIIEKDCRHCGGKHYVGGPIWSAPIHDLDFVRKVINAVETNNLSSRERLLGLLHVILEELWDVPLYYSLPKLCSKVKSLIIPMMTFRSAVLNGGYRISYSHASKASFKTDAPIAFIWDVIREWVKENPVSVKYEKENFTGQNILSKSVEYKIDFSLRPDANPLSRKNKLLRFPPNPAPFWGPGTRSVSNPEKPEKSIRNQNKKKRKAVAEPENSITKKVASEEEIVSS